MKKKVALLSFLSVLCLIFTSCKNTADSLPNADKSGYNLSNKNKEPVGSKEEWLLNISQSVTANLLELTYDDIFLEAFIASQDVSDIIKDWRGAKLDTNEIYTVQISEKNMKPLLNSLDIYDYDNLSDAGKILMRSQIGKTIPTIITGSKGADYLAAVSVLNYSFSYASEFDVDNQVWFIPTDKGGLSVYISFSNFGEGTVTVNSSYIYHGDEDLYSALNSYFSHMPIKVEKLN